MYFGCRINRTCLGYKRETSVRDVSEALVWKTG